MLFAALIFFPVNVFSQDGAPAVPPSWEKCPGPACPTYTGCVGIICGAEGEISGAQKLSKEDEIAELLKRVEELERINKFSAPMER